MDNYRTFSKKWATSISQQAGQQIILDLDFAEERDQDFEFVDRLREAFLVWFIDENNVFQTMFTQFDTVHIDGILEAAAEYRAKTRAQKTTKSMNFVHREHSVIVPFTTIDAMPRKFNGIAAWEEVRKRTIHLDALFFDNNIIERGNEKGAWEIVDITIDKKTFKARLLKPDFLSHEVGLTI